jgi:hypothetical protein
MTILGQDGGKKHDKALAARLVVRDLQFELSALCPWVDRGWSLIMIGSIVLLELLNKKTKQ